MRENEASVRTSLETTMRSRAIVERLKGSRAPRYLVLNKIDLLEPDVAAALLVRNRQCRRALAGSDGLQQLGAIGRFVDRAKLCRRCLAV